MRHRPGALLAAGLAALAGLGPARADTVAGYMDVRMAFATSGGSAGIGGGPIDYHLAGGLILGRAWLGAGFEGRLLLGETELSGDVLTDLALGPELKVQLGSTTGLGAYLRAGARRHWASGSPLVRSCRDTGVCDAGVFTDPRDYRGVGALGGAGLEYILRGAAVRNRLVGFHLEARYERIALTTISGQRTAHLFELALGVTVGGGRLQSRR